MSTAVTLLRLVTDKPQGVFPPPGKIAVHFLFNGWYVCLRYPAKLVSVAIQIYGDGGFRHTSPYKSGWSYYSFAAGLGFPPIDVARFSFPVVDLGLPAINYLQAQPWSAPCREILFLRSRVILYLYRDRLYAQRSGRTNALVVRSKRAEDVERVLAARDQHPREFTGDQGQMLAGDPAEGFGGAFQEHFGSGLVFLALRIAVGDRLDGHAIANLSPEGLEFGLDSLAVLLPEPLIL